MKKAKIVLAIIAIMGATGGALAVKASNFGGVQYFTTSVANAIPAGSIIGKITATGTPVYYTFDIGVAAPEENYGVVVPKL